MLPFLLRNLKILHDKPPSERRACFWAVGGRQRSQQKNEQSPHIEAPCTRGIFNTSRVTWENANVDGVKTKQFRCGRHTSISLNEVSCKCSKILWQQAAREMQKGFINEAVMFICASPVNAYTVCNCPSTGLNVSDVSQSHCHAGYIHFVRLQLGVRRSFFAKLLVQ